MALLGLWLGGCFSSGSTPAAVVIPKDPTGQAKCKVSKNQASPLVTEWPASEKANLEGLLSEGAVVVSYSGCEMRVLSQCKVEGVYKFKKTTLARDTIEISNEDDLYAKIPLGAASLEGELGKSGRLAIKTTVAGQLRLQDEVTELPQKSACEGATHVVTALSIGAFELMSGGAVGVKAGVDVGGVGVGGGHKSEESMLRSAGVSSACQQTTADKPNPDCSSPLQVFLAALETGSEPGDEGPTGDEPRDEPQPSAQRPPAKSKWQGYQAPDKSVNVQFELPADGGRWMLLSRNGDLLCELPCSQQVGRSSGLQLQLDADKQEDIKTVKVPDDLGYSPGRTIKAVPVPARNSTWLALGFYGGLLGAGVGAYLTIAGCKMEATTSSEGVGEEKMASEDQCYGGIGLLAGAGAIGLGTGIAWYVYRQEEGLDVTLVSDSKIRRQVPALAIRLGPGGGSISGSF